MSRRSPSGLARFVLSAALLASPCLLLAQRGGGGGGHVGGGTAGGGGLSGNGKPTGVSVKDDLKDFHEVLALQATSEQTGAFTALMKSTFAARVQLRAFLDQAGKPGPAAELASHGAALLQAIDSARNLNKLFLDGFSDRQKSGLKEIIRKLIKADSDLAQQTQALDQQLRDAKASSPQLASAGQTLERTLDTFQSQQLDLGKEISIGVANPAQALTFTIPPVKSSVSFENRLIAITTSGVISRSLAEGSQNTFALQLTADLSELQQNIAAILRSQLDKADRCGERISIQEATLTPLVPATLAFVRLHYERWTCFGASENEIVEGGGTIEVKLLPQLASDGSLRLESAPGRINAVGLLGDLLRSGPLGDSVRDKVAESLLSAMQRGGDLKVSLPPSAQANAALHRAQFQGSSSSQLVLVLDGDIQVSNDKLSAITSDLQERSASQTVPQLVPR